MSTEMTYEESVEVVKTTKESLKALRAELREFRKENNIKKDATPEDEKLAKKLAKMTAKIEALEADLEAAENASKALKPKKGGGFAKKHNYPEGMTDEKEKKKFRAKQRRLNKKSTEGTEAPAEGTSEEAPAKEKKSRKSEAPAED